MAADVTGEVLVPHGRLLPVDEYLSKLLVGTRMPAVANFSAGLELVRWNTMPAQPVEVEPEVEVARNNLDAALRVLGEPLKGRRQYDTALQGVTEARRALEQLGFAELPLAADALHKQVMERRSIDYESQISRLNSLLETDPNPLWLGMSYAKFARFARIKSFTLGKDYQDRFYPSPLLEGRFGGQGYPRTLSDIYTYKQMK